MRKLKKENTTQSTINNAKLPRRFLGVGNTPDNYGVFIRPNSPPSQK